MKRYFFLLWIFSFSLLFGQDSAQTPEKAPNPWEHPFFPDSSEQQASGGEGENFGSKFVRMLVILGFLVGFMILAAWMLRRMMRTRVDQLNTSSSIKVLETRALSSRSTLYLIEVEGQTLLIAESPTMVSHVASLERSSQETPR